MSIKRKMPLWKQWNFLFDDDLNIVSAIDWDAISIANNPETDWRIFMRFWNQYKQ